MTSARARWLFLVTLVALASCTHDEPEVSVSEALFACDLITAGKLGGLNTAQDPYQMCVAQCVSASSCETLEHLVCGGDESPLDSCHMQCLQAHGYTCGGQLIPPKYVCDGYNDCFEGGSDELDCPPDFVCADGSTLPPAYRCNEQVDCDDASDEADCPTATIFTCANGELIPASSVCNFMMDCADASDESDGCAQVACPTNG